MQQINNVGNQKGSDAKYAILPMNFGHAQQNNRGWRKPRRLCLPRPGKDSHGRTIRATGTTDDSSQKASGQTFEPMEQVSTDETVSNAETKSRTAYKDTPRTKKDQSSSSKSGFSDQDRKPEEKVTDEDDSDAMSDSDWAARHKAKKQEKIWKICVQKKGNYPFRILKLAYFISFQTNLVSQFYKFTNFFN